MKTIPNPKLMMQLHHFTTGISPCSKVPYPSVNAQYFINLCLPTSALNKAKPNLSEPVSIKMGNRFPTLLCTMAFRKLSSI